jgi:HEAT repeat protein
VGDLGSSDPNVAALAALSIASSEDPALRAQAVDPLCRLLGHRDPLVRSAAARALEAVTGVEQGYRAFRDPQDEAARIDSWRAVAERSLRGSLDP